MAFVDAASWFLSLLVFLLFIWARRPHGGSVPPLHNAYTMQPNASFGVDFSGTPSWNWWPSHHLVVTALEGRKTQAGTGVAFLNSSTRRRRSHMEKCLQVPLSAPFAKRISPFHRYLVDHTSALGGVPAMDACPGYTGYIPDYSATSAVWVGCTHDRFKDWTGYVCRHPTQNTVALKCFRFSQLPRCHLGDDMPCPAAENDVGCQAGLLHGETCTQACRDGFRVEGGAKHFATCPIEAPVCESVCSVKDVPKSQDFMPFTIEWNSLLQQGTVNAKKRGDACIPHTLHCGESPYNVRCGIATCPPLPWAGIDHPVRRGTHHTAKCPEGYGSAVPSVSCSLEGTWSYVHDACRLFQSPTIRIQKEPCSNNRKKVTKEVVFPGFPPIAENFKNTWWEPCISPPPECCPSHTIDASDGYYDKYNVPRCRCRYAKLGFAGASPCCSLQSKPLLPTMQFVAVYKGTFDVVPCNTTCSSASCYRHPNGCLAFNKTHMARGTPLSTQHYLMQAFTWKF